jgi:hypothetical protein
LARTLVTASRDDHAWGRSWHAPLTSSLSVRELTERVAELAGAPAPGLGRIDRDELTGLSAQQPLFAAELVEIPYSTENPHLHDSTETESVLGVRPTPWTRSCGSWWAAVPHRPRADDQEHPGAGLGYAARQAAKERT